MKHIKYFKTDEEYKNSEKIYPQISYSEDIKGGHVKKEPQILKGKLLYDKAAKDEIIQYGMYDNCGGFPFTYGGKYLSSFKINGVEQSKGKIKINKRYGINKGTIEAHNFDERFTFFSKSNRINKLKMSFSDTSANCIISFYNNQYTSLLFTEIDLQKNNIFNKITNNTYEIDYIAYEKVLEDPVKIDFCFGKKETLSDGTEKLTLIETKLEAMITEGGVDNIVIIKEPLETEYDIEMTFNDDITYFREEILNHPRPIYYPIYYKILLPFTFLDFSKCKFKIYDNIFGINEYSSKLKKCIFNDDAVGLNTPSLPNSLEYLVKYNIPKSLKYGKYIIFKDNTISIKFPKKMKYLSMCGNPVKALLDNEIPEYIEYVNGFEYQIGRKTLILPKGNVVLKGNISALSSMNEDGSLNANNLEKIIVPTDFKYSKIVDITIHDLYANKLYDCPWIRNHADGDIYIGNCYCGYKGDRNSVEEITIKDGTKFISSYALSGMPNLKKINFPDSIVYVGKRCFENCPLLDLSSYTNQDGEIYIGKCAYKLVLKNNSLTIKDGTLTIAYGAFNADASANKNIALNIPQSIIYISNYALETGIRGEKDYQTFVCDNLNLPNVLYIGTRCLGSSTFTNVKLDKIYEIMDDAFCNSKITNLNIGKNICAMGCLIMITNLTMNGDTSPLLHSHPALSDNGGGTQYISVSGKVSIPNNEYWSYFNSLIINVNKMNISETLNIKSTVYDNFIKSLKLNKIK